MQAPKLIELIDFLGAERGRKTALARSLDISESYLSQMLSGLRPMPAELCPLVERFTGGAVDRTKCRPLDGGRIWPELATEPQEPSHA